MILRFLKNTAVLLRDSSLRIGMTRPFLKMGGMHVIPTPFTPFRTGSGRNLIEQQPCPLQKEHSKTGKCPLMSFPHCGHRPIAGDENPE